MKPNSKNRIETKMNKKKKQNTNPPKASEKKETKDLQILQGRHKSATRINV